MCSQADTGVAWDHAPRGFEVPTREQLREIGIEDWIVAEVTHLSDGPWIIDGLITPWLLGEVADGNYASVLDHADRCVADASVLCEDLAMTYEALGKAYSGQGDSALARECEQRHEFYEWAKKCAAPQELVDRCTELLAEWPGEVDRMKLIQYRGFAHTSLGNKRQARRDHEAASEIGFACFGRFRT